MSGLYGDIEQRINKLDDTQKEDIREIKELFKEGLIELIHIRKLLEKEVKDE